MRPPGRFRRQGGPFAPVGVVGTVIVLVAGVVGAGVALAGPTDPAASCRPITLYAVGDSGADSTPTLSGVTDPLSERFGERVSVVTVPPPTSGSSYAASETEAVAALATVVSEHMTACPTGSLMLFGHSQGAHVAGDLASRIGTGQEKTIPAPRMLAVGLFGDPARHPGSRSVPEGTSGQGALAPRAAGFGSLDARTIEICAPGDPVCDSPADKPAPDLSTAMQSPAHQSYADLAVVPGTPVARWAAESLGTVITRTPVGEDVDGASATGQAPSPTRTSPSPAAASPPTSQPRRSPTRTPSSSATAGADRPGQGPGGGGSPGRDTGATWAMSSGLEGFKSTPWNNQDATDPSAAASPNVSDRQVVKFQMPGGGKRTEAEPDVPNFQEGQTSFVGYSGYFADGFPVGTGDWQLIMQFKQPGTGSPPLAVEVGNGQLRLANNGTGQKDFCPVRAGAPFSFRLRITFGGEIDAWCGERQTLNGYRTPSSNVNGSAYLKTGIYRNPGVGGDSTLFLNDLRIGPSLESVSGLAGAGSGGGAADGPGGATSGPSGPATSSSAGADAPDIAAETTAGTPPSASTTRRRPATPAGGGQKICEKFGSTDIAGGRYMVQNNEWGASDGQCVTATVAGFTVDSGNHSKNDAPAAYPSIMSGCWMGTCTEGTTLPARIGGLGPITSSIAATLPAGTKTNLAYDIWADSTPKKTGQNDTLELMIWLREDGGIDPIGQKSGTATIGGAAWDVWTGENGGVAVISYVRQGYVDSADALPITAFVSDAVKQGVVSADAYLTNIQAGFEPWTGGPGLSVDDFSVEYGGAAG